MAKSRSEVGYLFRLLFLALGGLALVSLLGTAGYDLLTDGRYPLFDSFYMTFVTISTIGFGEIIDMSNNTPARILTVTLAVFGTGMLSMAFSIVTVIVLESDINGTLKRKRMEKSIKKLKDHYILCGLGRVGRNVANELIATDPIKLRCPMPERFVPMTRVGMPVKLRHSAVSTCTLKRARRRAAQRTKKSETAQPSRCGVSVGKLQLKTRMAGAAPKVNMSDSESSWTPNLLVLLVSRATQPSRASAMLAKRIAQTAYE